MTQQRQDKHSYSSSNAMLPRTAVGDDSNSSETSQRDKAFIRNVARGTTDNEEGATRLDLSTHKDDGNSVKLSPHCHLAMDDETREELEICLHFNVCFDEGIRLEQSIEDAFKMSDLEEYTLSFDATQLMPRRNESECEFVLSHKEIVQAYDALDIVVKRLSKDLKTKIDIKRAHWKDSNAIEEEKTSDDKSFLLPGPPMSSLLHDKPTENSNEKNLEQDVSVSPSKNKEWKRTTDKVREENIEKAPKDTSVVVEVQIQKSFDSPLQVKHFINNDVGENLAFEFSLVEESIAISQISTSCLIKTGSKEEALEMKRAFLDIYLEMKVKVKCHIQDPELESRELKKKRSKAQADIQRRIEEVLNIHLVKIGKLQEEIRMIRSNIGKFAVIDEDEKENALTDKIKELQMQEKEFKDRCQSLNRDLNKCTEAKDMNCVLKRVGIECNRLTNALPIYARRGEIIRQVISNQVSIILGETGSGKSTQMAQYFYDAGLGKDGCIVCTQPRRVAATTLAERVATEMAERVGGVVGYKAGSARKTKPNTRTRIFFTTDYALLNDCIDDPQLTKFSCIIVDEAHERSIYTDILLGMIKVCLSRRTDLKLVITSATIDPKVFVRYFRTGPELRVSGRTFPVDVSYAEDDKEDFENYEKKAVSKALDIHLTEGPGDILVFLSSPVEIMRCCEEFEKRMSGNDNFQCLPLHGQLPADQQKMVFEKLSDDKRKVVFCTNCAETSITIDGIKYVVDTGVAKEMKYDSKRNMSQLGVFVISQSSAEQRKGRAGRTSSGKCFRLYSQDGFDMMDSINEPEILRVHLGQATLKLAELGVNIESYDFIQAPSDTALKSAMHTLQYLGAIVDGSITDLGRWIAKLPFDPKLGFIIYEANKRNLLFDAIALAAVLSTGSDLFYRGFSEAETQVVSRSKNEFSSEYGDSFTWLNVYKAWSQVSKKDKVKWCRDNGLNSKSISYAHQSIQEVKNVVSRDLNVEMEGEFSEDTNAMNDLRWIVCEANAFSICNYSGNTRGGYYCLIQESQVYVHPSSILNEIEIRPEWIVYNELVKTSKDFIKGVTAVDEEWVRWLVAVGKLNVDLETAKKRKLSLVHREEVGPTVFRALVGPRFTNLRVLQEELSNNGMPKSVLNANSEFHTLEINSSHDMSPDVLDKFREIKSKVGQRLMSEESEFKLNKDNLGSPSMRMIIGNGGCIKTILMPDQSNKVLIIKPKPSTSEEDIKDKFKGFGTIEKIIPFKKRSETWGFISYSSVAEAMAAVEATKNDECHVGKVMLERGRKINMNKFIVKVNWLRKPVKGKGTAFITCSPLDKVVLVDQTVIVGSPMRSCKMQVSRKNEDDLIMFNTGARNEEEVTNAIAASLTCRGLQNVSVGVKLERVHVPQETQEQLASMEARITSFIKNELGDEGFYVRVLKPNKNDYDYVGLVSFTNPEDGQRVCQLMRQGLFIGGREVEVSPSFKTMMHVPIRIKIACQERFDEIFEDAKAQYKDTALKWREQKHDFAIEIRSPKPEDIVKIKDSLNKEIEGEIIDCSEQGVAGCLLGKAGKEFIQSVEKSTGCLIVFDFPREKIHLHGSASNVGKALEDIKGYLVEIQGCQQELFSVKGQGKPVGLMKMTMVKFGSGLDRLVEETQLKAVDINWKKGCIRLTGSEAAVSKARQMLDALEEEACKNMGSTDTAKDTFLPDCSVCLCPVEGKELSRLEMCGHAYCQDCLQHQFSFSVNNKEFPLTCAYDGCNSVFVLKDIRLALSRKWLDEDRFTSMSLNAFVQVHNSKYKFCPTPNCLAVYEVTSKDNSHEFNCPVCSTSVCTSCHGAFHFGMSCESVKSQAKADVDMLAWMKSNSGNAKPCPNCQFLIEKAGGCNKMHCTVCHACFCWVCLLKCQDEQDCYRHLQKVHGGFI